MKQVFFYFLLVFIMMILVLIMILLGVAFLTLMERKLLSYMQGRKGPNKVGFNGLLQPFSDALKLLTKESFFMLKSNYIYYLISPIFMLILIMMMWIIYPFYSNLIGMELGLIYLMCCLSVSSYGLLISGWSSNSSYSMLGSIRSLSQSISYEVSLSLIILSFVLMTESFNLMNFMNFQNNLSLMFIMMPMALFFFISFMAELNRTPFDFSEGESELVSGFNIEYMSGGFVLIFLAEYASIIYMSFLFSFFFLNGNFFNYLFYFKVMMIIIMVVWLRGTLPRFRYDLLMYLCWLIILPFILNYLFILMLIKLMIYKFKMMEF